MDTILQIKRKFAQMVWSLQSQSKREILGLRSTVNDVPALATECSNIETASSERGANLKSLQHVASPVLVVDDDPMERDLVTSVLTKGGRSVVCAGSAREAISAAEHGNISLILMDVRMPKIDGIEATRLIRSIKGSAGNVPILALTAQDSDACIKRCRAAGMDGFLGKPINLNTFAATISQAIFAVEAQGQFREWLGSLRYTSK